MGIILEVVNDVGETLQFQQQSNTVTVLNNPSSSAVILNNPAPSIGLTVSTGPAGLSAYEVAVNNGYTGTQAQWLASLASAAGATTVAGISDFSAGVQSIIGNVILPGDNVSFAYNDTNKTITISAVAGGSSGSGALPTGGTTSQYLRGDGSWQTLDKTAAGLANVDNTSDTNKPVSTAQASAISNAAAPGVAAKVDTDAATSVNTPSTIVKRDVNGVTTANRFRSFSATPITVEELTRKDYVDAGDVPGVAAKAATDAATSSNTANAIVKRDGTGTIQVGYASLISAPSSSSHAIRKQEFDAEKALTVHLAGTEVITGAKTFSGAVTFSSTVTGIVSSSISDFTTAVDARVQNIVGAAPAALDTLSELASALGNDANYAATVTTALATKAVDTAVVHLAGTETVSGSKTFSAAPTMGSGMFMGAGSNMVLNSSTGTMIGSTAVQKLGFWGTAAVIQPLATTELGTVLSSIGLRAAGSAYPITTSGAVTFTGAVNFTGATITGLSSTGSALKSETIGYRMRTTANEAAPTATNWPARPSGYLFVVSVGADPSPNDQVAGDQRQIPVTS